MKKGDVRCSRAYKKLRDVLVEVLAYGYNINLYKINVKEMSEPTNLLRSSLCKTRNNFYEVLHNGFRTLRDSQPRAVSRCQAWHKKQLKAELEAFNKLLSCFKSCQDFTLFLDEISKEIKGKKSGLNIDEKRTFNTFKKECKMFFDCRWTQRGVSHQRYLVWVNQTIYSKRHLIGAVWSKFFGANDVNENIGFKGKKGEFKVLKSRSVDETGAVSMLKDQLGGYKLPRNVVETTLASKLIRKALNKLGHRDVSKYDSWQGGITQSFGFKFLVHGLSSYGMRSQFERQKKAKAQHMEKVKSVTGFDLYKVRDLIQLNTGLDILGEPNGAGKLRVLLKQSYFKDLQQALNAGADAVVVNLGKKNPQAVIQLKDLALELYKKFTTMKYGK